MYRYVHALYLGDGTYCELAFTIISGTVQELKHIVTVNLFAYTNLLCVEFLIIHSPQCSCSVGSLCPVKSATRLRVKG